MFDWIGKIVEAISNSIGSMVSFLGTQLANAIFDAILKWFYEMIYNAVADFFTEMGKMGAEMFDLSWVQATVTLFTYFGWALFAAGTVVAIFDVAVEYQSGRANIKTASINVRLPIYHGESEDILEKGAAHLEHAVKLILGGISAERNRNDRIRRGFLGYHHRCDPDGNNLRGAFRLRQNHEQNKILHRARAQGICRHEGQGETKI